MRVDERAKYFIERQKRELSMLSPARTCMGENEISLWQRLMVTAANLQKRYRYAFISFIQLHHSGLPCSARDASSRCIIAFPSLIARSRLCTSSSTSFPFVFPRLVVVGPNL